MMTFQHKLIFGATLLATIHAYAIDSQPYSSPLCESQIYCSGDVLHTIQMAHIFNDSKNFVDMKLKRPENETVRIFYEFMDQHDNNPTKDDIKQFVNANFEKRGTEFDDWIPSDWTDSPKYLNNVKDDNFREFGHELNKLWKILGRKMKDEVANNPELYSIIYVKNGVIVPGGRFLEFYYWDTYWIMLGLLRSEMYTTVRGMLGNFFSVIDRYGFIPNGGRVYYLIRTQPPLLANMVKAYVDITGDYDILSEAIQRLDIEYAFFENNRSVNVHGHKLFTYGANVLNGPRPESYREDVKTAEFYKKDSEKMKFYTEMNGGAESGFDFTSRWFIRDGTNDGCLHDINARSIVPVELNAIMYFNAKTLAQFHDKLGNTNIAAKYENKAQLIYEGIEAILWDEELGVWFDYDLINEKPRSYFAITNLSPLYFNCFNESNKPSIARKVLAYIHSTPIDSFPGGVPTTLMHTGEQWDYPNAWAPLQHWLSEGLRALDDEEATELANKWTRRWTLSNYIAYNETKAMFEKYLADTLGGHGGGGEYEVQIGFGWTNGVIIEYLAKYGDILHSFD